MGNHVAGEIGISTWGEEVKGGSVWEGSIHQCTGPLITHWQSPKIFCVCGRVGGGGGGNAQFHLH